MIKLNIEKKTFVNNKGETVEFTELSFMLAGQKIRVKPVDDDKKLCAYLLANSNKGDIA